MKRIVRLVALTGALALGACASQAPATSTGTASHQQGSTASGDAARAPKGYYHKVVDGQDEYCRNDVDTGSRVSRTEVCLTREQLDEQQRNNQDLTHQIQGTGIH